MRCNATQIPTIPVKIPGWLTCDQKVTYHRPVTRAGRDTESAAASGVERADHTDDDVVFKALADGTRRGLLDALFVLDGQSVQSLCARVPGMTRFGVMKHLGVLEESNLITTRRSGRSKQHFLNPVPIQQVADRWVGKYAQPFTRALVDLHDALDPRSHHTRESTRESA
ncbi:MAG: hypothetical protein RLZZ623_3896 [Actinomycetota bacterium]|jgi:DNA-binding transcriptional ArsR family regulator